MTTPRPTRPALRLAAGALTLGAVLAGAPATADVPVGWPEPPSIPLMDGLLVYLFAPLGLFVLVTLLTVAPSLARGERLGVERSSGDEWFGGRRGGPDELESGTPAKDTGGASGKW